ncbi:MAG: ATP-binding cassette domain-containing protein [Asgard group archaeon]|nr:ATP-binding cassette domain-containing protein [Asgard group archaeon]
MKIQIKGARENNLKNIDVELTQGLTVITGISGSGKSSLVYDTLYHEARRRFIDIFTPRSSRLRLPKANVDTITGISPAVAVDQNVLNRNPNSILATAAGLHPFFRILYANFGVRFCPKCSSDLSVYSEDEIIERIKQEIRKGPISILAPILRRTKGSHKTLLQLIKKQFDFEAIIINGKIWDGKELTPVKEHTIEINLADFSNEASTKQIREIVQQAFDLGSPVINIKTKDEVIALTKTRTCVNCGYWFTELEPKYFHMPCEHCKGKGCEICKKTGLHPEAAAVRWQGKRLPELLTLSVDEIDEYFKKAFLPKIADRLKREITKRIKALKKVGLGYLTLNRSSPTLSRGEAQRVRLAIILTSELEDMLHILDEPTIGQHPNDVMKFLPAFRELAGPVVYVEHDRVAAAVADQAIDIGPGAGKEGGEVIFNGTTKDLWLQKTPTGRYFSFQEKVIIPKLRPKPKDFLLIKNAFLRNLKNIDIPIPYERISVITGVSGSGKSTLVKDVLVASLLKKEPKGCEKIEGKHIKPILVDQSPIGRNPRSNPATYTKLSDIIRDIFAKATDYTKSHFTFNREEGQCPACKGIGAEEVKLPYIAPIWLPCELCGGKRFKNEILQTKVNFNGIELSIGDFYELSIKEAAPFILESEYLSEKNKKSAEPIINALVDIGLGYLHLGQPSPTLSGGEAQRVKLAKYLGMKNLTNNLIVLDEPSTGLHPKDLSGLLMVFDRLARVGATIVIVEHNTDIIRACDWVVDLGPGAGPSGGKLIFCGSVEELLECKKSLTGIALLNEEKYTPHTLTTRKIYQHSDVISIRGARANNLKGISTEIPKGSLTVVTGVSGSGKSSLVNDVLELEARRRFLESLSLYERQSANEGPEAPVDSITGLGVTAFLRSSYNVWRIDPRYHVGRATEILDQLFNFITYIGDKDCLNCGSAMRKGEKYWICSNCNTTAEFIQPNYLSPMSLNSSCPKCKGLGYWGKPNVDKLIIHPEKPICNGAMYSPGFWPYGYYCKPLNHAYYLLQEMGRRYNFNPYKTPWNEMPEEAKNLFLFGSDEKWDYEVEGRRREGIVKYTTKHRVWGIYQSWGGFTWFSFGDIFETYSDKYVCEVCKGQKLREEYLTFKLKGYNIHQLRQMTLQELEKVITQIKSEEFAGVELLQENWWKIIRKLKYLRKVGLGYLNCDRPTYNLSAGEYERMRLASILGSGLTSLTILLDEPTRGLHPSEVNDLLEVLQELRNEGNTVIVVEHDPEIIKGANHILDLGPKSGIEGGKITAQGTLNEIMKTNTVTAQWLSGKKKTNPFRNYLHGEQKLLINIRKKPTKWLTIKGAKENNLKGEEVKIPLGVLLGVCGVSGSGKSSLIIDTLGLAIAPKKITSSLHRERMKAGEHESIIGAPNKALLVDQSKRKINSPLRYFGLKDHLIRIYTKTADADILGITEKHYKKRCSACKGDGRLGMDMGFLPTVYSTCDICKGTGHASEAWDVKGKGYSLPELTRLTIEEVYTLFKNENEIIKRYLKAAIDVGLGYLVLQQPAYTLSGGEAQRLKIAKELCKKTKENVLYIMDEPTVGQHLDDIERLIGILQRLVDEGNSVIVVEHHPNILAACDWLIELGPVGGPEGGYIIASGSPEDIAKGTTPTAPYIKNVLEGNL